MKLDSMDMGIEKRIIRGKRIEKNSIGKIVVVPDSSRRTTMRGVYGGKEGSELKSSSVSHTDGLPLAGKADRSH